MIANDSNNPNDRNDPTNPPLRLNDPKDPTIPPLRLNDPNDPTNCTAVMTLFLPRSLGYLAFLLESLRYYGY
jgi:hypothetical protein